MIYLYVAVGGAFGSLMRFISVRFLQAMLGKELPYSTFIINIFGSFLLGVVVALIAGMLPRGRELYMLLAVGMLGSFTPFSFFSFDSYMLLERGQWLALALYTAGSVVLGVGAFFAGLATFKFLIT